MIISINLYNKIEKYYFPIIIMGWIWYAVHHTECIENRLVSSFIFRVSSTQETFLCILRITYTCDAVKSSDTVLTLFVGELHQRWTEHHLQSMTHQTNANVVNKFKIFISARECARAYMCLCAKDPNIIQPMLKKWNKEKENQKMNAFFRGIRWKDCFKLSFFVLCFFYYYLWSMTILIADEIFQFPFLLALQSKDIYISSLMSLISLLP